MRKASALLGALTALGLIVLLAGGPQSLDSAVFNYIAPQGTQYGRTLVLNTGAQPFGAGNGVPDLFGAGDLLVLSNLETSGGITCALTVSSSVSFVGTFGTATQCSLTATISGAPTLSKIGCFPVLPSQPKNQVAKATSANKTRDLRSRGVCRTRGRTVLGEECYAHCRSDGDCTELSAGSTCELAPDSDETRGLRERPCMILECDPENDDSSLHVAIEG